ncbi:MAG: relaxase domain-containing protein [Actinobacteria bacterium]|jgi:Ti-type conjugative transfer relaxase TraA|nr:relaxase domain-containing protein [Actinomycetota bacterium]
MLNIGKLAHGGAEYYLTSVASSVEAYYTGAGEAPGRWLGSASTRLGVSGLVTPETLRTVLAGADPADGRPLVGPGRTVPGFDLTFRAPKSVSLLWALADPEVARQVRDAHDAAVVAALDYLERNAAYTRRGKAGREQLEADGFVAAAFRHRTSRADDPLLHTHVLVANLAQAADDDMWRSLDARHLYLHAKTAGYLYQAQLRAELTRRLDVTFGPVTNGYADLDGIPRAVIEAFSRRRADILATLAATGHHSPRAAQIATLTTRSGKSHADADRLRTGWKERAAALGFGARELAALTRTRETETAAIDEQQLARDTGWLLGPAGLTAKASTFTRRDTIRGWCERLRQGAEITDVERLADRLLADDTAGTIRLTGTASPIRHVADATGIRLADGRFVALGTGEARYTTPQLLALEQRLVDTALALLDTGRATVTDPTRERALMRRPTLTVEQRAAVGQLTRSGHGVEVLVGRAGTGKTYTLGAAREVWEAAGIEVVGCALAARAALELQAGSGIASSTIDRLLADLARPGSSLPAGGVLVVDEAGMVGTRTLARLLDAAQTTATKLVLVGDHHQLPEIDAGGAFAGLANRLPAIELTDNRRQQQPWEIVALDELRHGDLTAAVDAYRTHGRLVVADTADHLREQLVGDWWHANAEHGTDAVMVAARRTDIDDLNRRARIRLAADGQLSGPALDLGGAEFRVGDRLLCLRNHRHLGVLNGTRGTVTDIDHHDRSLAFRRDDNGRQVRLPADYLDAGHVTHGYALTAHKAQGLTCDATFVLGSEEIYREWGYVALSRGRTNNRLYLTADHLDHEQPDDPTHPEVHQHDPRTADERLLADLHRSHRQTLALDHLQPSDRDPAGVDLERPAGPAPHLVRALGPRPHDPDPQHIWDTAAGVIETYRAEHGIDDELLPLGPLPDQDDARAAYQQAVHALLAGRRALRDHTPDQPRDRDRDLGRGVA